MTSIQVNRIRLAKPGEAYQLTCRLAAMAGQERPNFVEWGKVYDTPEGRFRIVSAFRDTDRNEYEDDHGRVRRLPGRDTFHELDAYLERVE
jgi:hypothetical protein